MVTQDRPARPFAKAPFCNFQEETGDSPAISPWVTAMDKLIAQLNIEHFRKLLAEEADQSKRLQIQKLLAEEQIKLQALSNRPTHKECSSDKNQL